ncbi:MAG: hypothetical protein JOZ73_05835 [Solirubrobacterales bacterium]|nr:hypothetical protein [Solirubrobacterales bacterium]
MRKLTKFAMRRAAKKAFGSAGEMIRELAETAGSKGIEAIRDAADRASDATPAAEQVRKGRRLPIQKSIDVAVPIRVAWEEWSSLESLPEGIHTITDIERDGDELFGRIKSPRAQDWEAEILDEREQQSFAWQSHEGTDCAGLATFHSLSKRLTRIELNLDVVPKTPAEGFQLTTHIADHRAETELRQFKARLELINPDLYEAAEEEDAPEEERAEEGGQTEDGQTGEAEGADEGDDARSAEPEDAADEEDSELYDDEEALPEDEEEELPEDEEEELPEDEEELPEDEEEPYDEDEPVDDEDLEDPEQDPEYAETA